MTEPSKFTANGLLFAVIIALLLQPMAGIDSSTPIPSELADEPTIFHSSQNEWSESAGTATVVLVQSSGRVQ